MFFADFLGLIGAFLSAITFIPQVILAYKSKSVGDLSWAMLWIVFCSVIIWLVYGILKQLVLVILAN